MPSQTSHSPFQQSKIKSAISVPFMIPAATRFVSSDHTFRLPPIDPFSLIYTGTVPCSYPHIPQHPTSSSTSPDCLYPLCPRLHPHKGRSTSLVRRRLPPLRIPHNRRSSRRHQGIPSPSRLGRASHDLSHPSVSCVVEPLVS